MSAKNIINIREACKNEIDIVGGKGANLGIMISSEIPVPDGFIVTAHAYKSFLQNNGITEIIHEKIKNINKDHTCIKAETEHIRNLILKSQFSKEMKEDIENRYNAFKKPVHLAVRSSATAEDLPDASFAGQQETYLNVMKIEDVFLSIKKCFASLWSIRSFSYRENNGYNHFDVAIAVVIQEMIESEISGILFTANPVSGEKQTIIDASYNLGEAIVSGRVTPDNYILDENGNEISFTLGNKDISIIYSDDGTKTIKNPNSMKERRCLNEKDLKKLFCEASKVENLYKKPMDIEWAIKDKKVYILQARPITTIDTIKKEIKSSRTYSKKEKEYLNNMIEHFPVVCYPLDFNIAMILQNMKYELFEEAGLKFKSPIRMDDMGIIYMDNFNWKISGKIVRFLKVYSEYKDNENNISCGEEILKTCEGKLKILEKEIMDKNKNFTFSEISYYSNKLVEIHKKISYARFRYFLFPSVMIGEKLDKKLKKINSNYSEYDLLSELKYVTVNMNKEIDNILKLLSKNDNCIKDLLVESNDYMILKKKYSTEFQLIDRFLKQYGWKSNYCCIPFSSISWYEDPNRFLNLLRVTMTSKLKDNADESNKYKNILKDIENHISKKELNKMMKDISYYRLAHVRREESQYLWETGFGLLRVLLQRVAILLNVNKNDLLYLSFNELEEVMTIGKLTDTHVKIISNRKSHHKEAEENWNQMTIDAFYSDEEDFYKGISGSPGIVKGKVCIVRTHSEFNKLKEGDILVCPYTDPEWTPLFKLAKAVVSDTGGALSHAAIVAREYNIPAVLGVGNSTMNLLDGDFVLVDGNKGSVRKISEDLI